MGPQDLRNPRQVARDAWFSYVMGTTRRPHDSFDSPGEVRALVRVMR